MKWNLVPLVLLSVALAGCGIPPSMQVRDGGEPRYQDQDVLFRTTYYFRVFDFCDDGSGNQSTRRIKSDSLYRFKMTGKGKSSFSKVRFESGTLPAWQIDPFGASVEFDKETGKPHFVSQQKREEELGQNKLYEEVRRLRALSDKLKCSASQSGTAPNSGNQAQCQIIQGKIEDNLRLIGPGGTVNVISTVSATAQEAVRLLALSLRDVFTQTATVTTVAKLRDTLNAAKEEIRLASDKLSLLVALDKAETAVNGLKADANLKAYTLTPKGQPPSTDDDKKARVDAAAKLLQQARYTLLSAADAPPSVATQPDKALVCGDGLPARRGFQVLGPEGWRTFDQDERLILAMSSNGHPLLDALRDLSNRVLTEKAAGLSQERLLTETLAASRARVELGKVESANADKLSDALTEVLQAFDKQQGGE